MSTWQGSQPQVREDKRITIETPITPHELDLMITHLLRLPGLRERFLQELRVDHFQPVTEGLWQTVWLAVQSLHARYRDGLTPLILFSEICRLKSQRPELIQPYDLDRLVSPNGTGLLSWIYSLSLAQLSEDYGRDLVRKFIYEREVLSPLRTCLLHGMDSGHYIGNLPKILEESLRVTQRVSSIGSTVYRETMPDRLTTKLRPDIRLLSGLTFLDGPLCGQREGDVNGYIGPIGAGKSTMMRHMSVAASRQFWAASDNGRLRPKVAILVTYEQETSEVQKPLWSNAAEIAIRRFRDIGGDMSRLNPPGTFLEYERAIHEAASRAGNPIMSESERWDATQAWLNKTHLLIDMSEGTSAGTGGIDELVGTIETLCSRLGGPEIGWIGIDYALLAVRRYMRARGINEDKMRHYINSFGDDLRRKIAEQYKCIAWVTSQVSGAASKRSPTARLSHLDTAEGSMFAENMAVCGAMSPRCQITGCIQLNWSKIRYEGGLSPFYTLRINPDFCRMEDVSAEYTAAVNGRQFVRTADLARIQGPIDQPGRSRRRVFEARPDDDGDFG